MSKLPAVAIALIFLTSGCTEAPQPQERSAADRTYIPVTSLRTSHYILHSSASETETKSVSIAVESLYNAYVRLFPPKSPAAELNLVLYKDQVEFKRHSRSSPWAEAYYKRPYSYAYPGTGENPHHWMLHEATHQLLAEAGGYRPRRWLNEGIASYFGASALLDGSLDLGRPDPAAYPIWWLKDVRINPNAPPTFQERRLPSLEQLVEDTGPPIGENVNHYYIAYWSLVHYLFHGDNGAHRVAVQALLEQRGSPQAFKQLVGAYDVVEPRWHAHLADLASGQTGIGRGP
ncbi:MAG: DUF1570 domain-containing protein [Stenotrophomonas sp.]